VAVGPVINGEDGVGCEAPFPGSVNQGFNSVEHTQPPLKNCSKNKQNPLGFWGEQSVNGPIDTRF